MAIRDFRVKKISVSNLKLEITEHNFFHLGLFLRMIFPIGSPKESQISRRPHFFFFWLMMMKYSGKLNESMYTYDVICVIRSYVWHGLIAHIQFFWIKTWTRKEEWKKENQFTCSTYIFIGMTEQLCAVRPFNFQMVSCCVQFQIIGFFFSFLWSLLTLNFECFLYKKKNRHFSFLLRLLTNCIGTFRVV